MQRDLFTNPTRPADLVIKKNDFTKYRKCVINHYKHKYWGDWPHLKGSGHTPLGHDLAPLITLGV